MQNFIFGWNTSLLKCKTSKDGFQMLGIQTVYYSIWFSVATSLYFNVWIIHIHLNYFIPICSPYCDNFHNGKKLLCCSAMLKCIKCVYFLHTINLMAKFRIGITWHYPWVRSNDTNFLVCDLLLLRTPST